MRRGTQQLQDLCFWLTFKMENGIKAKVSNVFSALFFLRKFIIFTQKQKICANILKKDISRERFLFSDILCAGMMKTFLTPILKTGDKSCEGRKNVNDRRMYLEDPGALCFSAVFGKLIPTALQRGGFSGGWKLLWKRSAGSSQLLGKPAASADRIFPGGVRGG